MTQSSSNGAMPRLACLFAGAIWGLFWMPLRAISEAGINGLWTSAIWFAVPAACLLPLAVKRWHHIRDGGIQLQITAILAGVALLLYTLAFVYTDVVRAMLLYYLTPMWSTLLARAMLGEVITGQRIFAMALALIGMLTIFGLGLNFPVPRNLGDWFGLGSGIVWSIAVVRLRKFQTHSAIDMTSGFFFWSLVAALIVCVMIAPGEAPSRVQIMSVLPWLVPIMVIAVIPGAFASLWGPKFISPGLAGLLFMTEIIFGSISAALFANEPFGTREIIGILLIASASLVEPLHDLAKERAKKTAHL